MTSFLKSSLSIGHRQGTPLVDLTLALIGYRLVGVVVLSYQA